MSTTTAIQEGFQYFARFSTSPLIPLGEDVAAKTGFTPQASVAILDEELYVGSFGVSSEVKQLLGEDTVYALIGKLSGFDSDNNPEISVRFMVPDALNPVDSLEPELVFKKTGGYFAVQKNQWAQQQLGNVIMQERNLPLRLYGEHDNSARLDEFWKVFVYRLTWGDSIPHAALVAREHLKIWRSASSLQKQFRWMRIPVNSLSGGNRADTGFADAAVKLFSTRFLDAICSRAQTLMDERYPQYAQSVKNSNAYKVVAAPKPLSLAQASSGGRPTLYAGLAMGAIGAYLLSKGKK